MTNRTSPKKVVKKIEKPKNHRINWQIVKHFEPSTNYAANHRNLNAKIPIILDSDNDKPYIPRASHTSFKKETVTKMPITRQANSTNLKKNKKPSVDKLPNPSKVHVEQKTLRQPFIHLCCSSSSSSLEHRLEKFTNHRKIKSKSCHAGSLKKPNSSKQLIRSARRVKVCPSQKSLKSHTDPSLIERKLQLKSLKQEILENQMITSPRKYKPDIFTRKESPRFQGLKSEILQAKTNNLLKNKVLITELRSEIAHYKNFNNFQVYNSYEGDLNKKPKDDSHTNNIKSIQKKQLSTLKRVSISEEDSEKQQESTNENSSLSQNISRSQERSSRERYKSGTDKESALEPTDRPSTSTVDSSYKVVYQQKQHSDPESLDDDIIRNKIHEANLLIDRVKKALGKIKAIKSGTESVDGESGVSKASSTDIEQTIENLKMDTANLITGDLLVKKSKPKCSCIYSNKLSENTRKISAKKKECAVSILEDLNKAFIKEDERRKCCPDTKPIKSASKIPIFTQSFEALDNVGPRPPCVKDDIDFDRPKTRRNELEDDLAEQLRRDKFRTCPENGHIAISSSIEELQAKLQTISESTESSYSTPIKKRREFPLNSKCCITDPPRTESKQIQVASSQTTTGVLTCCSTEHKSTQFSKNKPLINHMRVDSFIPTPKCLESKNLPPQDIGLNKRLCTSCKIEYLPILELLPPKKKQVCDKCKMDLNVEHLEGISIPSKLAKLQRLCIKILPPVIIKQAMTLTPVLNLSISPEGVSENRIQNTQNVGFIEMKFLDNTTSTIFNNVQPPIEKDEYSKPAEGESFISQSHYHDKEELPLDSGGLSDSDNLSNESELELAIRNILNSQKIKDPNEESVKTPESIILETPSANDKHERDIVYKSFLIFDNPNKHDPGQLDQESKEKMSQINLEFYKTFINPNPNPVMSSEQNFTSVASRNKILGFESKMIQCNESMISDNVCWLDGGQIAVSKKINLDSKKDLKYEVSESRLTIDNIEAMESDKKQMQSTVEVRGSYTESNQSSPSEITVTVSYSSSYDESVIQETELNTTNLDRNVQESSRKLLNSGTSEIPETPSGQEEKRLTVMDKEVISKLHEKLKTVDTTTSQPTLVMTKDSQDLDNTLDNFIKGLINVEEKSKDSLKTPEVSPEESETRNETVNYLLNGDVGVLKNSYPNPLKLAKNGRYKDEENMFTQVAHPTITSTYQRVNNDLKYERFKKVKSNVFKHKDMELAKDKFVTIPRHKLNNYSPDTSNSDTVTTNSNSVSEGEVVCRHSVSNGEIHVCRHNPQCPPARRNILTRRKPTYPQTHRLPLHLISYGAKKFDLSDPKVTIEHRRNYFNNWVTYYVRPQDVFESTASSSCSNNKK